MVVGLGGGGGFIRINPIVFASALQLEYFVHLF
jgi:hypothetical protein